MINVCCFNKWACEATVLHLAFILPGRPRRKLAPYQLPSICFIRLTLNITFPFPPDKRYTHAFNSIHISHTFAVLCFQQRIEYFRQFFDKIWILSQRQGKGIYLSGLLLFFFSLARLSISKRSAKYAYQHTKRLLGGKKTIRTIYDNVTMVYKDNDVL